MDQWVKSVSNERASEGDNKILEGLEESEDEDNNEDDDNFEVEDEFDEN